jgi:hypothetical protein
MMAGTSNSKEWGIARLIDGVVSFLPIPMGKQQMANRLPRGAY